MLAEGAVPAFDAPKEWLQDAAATKAEYEQSEVFSILSNYFFTKKETNIMMNQKMKTMVITVMASAISVSAFAFSTPEQVAQARQDIAAYQQFEQIAAPAFDSPAEELAHYQQEALINQRDAARAVRVFSENGHVYAVPAFDSPAEELAYCQQATLINQRDAARAVYVFSENGPVQAAK